MGGKLKGEEAQGLLDCMVEYYQVVLVGVDLYCLTAITLLLYVDWEVFHS